MNCNYALAVHNSTQPYCPAQESTLGCRSSSFPYCTCLSLYHFFDLPISYGDWKLKNSLTISPINLLGSTKSNHVHQHEILSASVQAVDNSENVGSGLNWDTHMRCWIQVLNKTLELGNSWNCESASMENLWLPRPSCEFSSASAKRWMCSRRALYVWKKRSLNFTALCANLGCVNANVWHQLDAR